MAINDISSQGLRSIVARPYKIEKVPKRERKKYKCQHKIPYGSSYCKHCGKRADEIDWS